MCGTRFDMSVQSIKMLFTRSYLLRCDTGFLMIDTAYINDYGSFVQELIKMEIQLPVIRYILLTHHHNDHTGLAATLVSQTGARIICHEKAVDLLRKGENKLAEPVNQRARLISILLKLIGRMYSFPPVIISHEDIIVTGDDDQVLRNIGIDGKLLYTPGHSMDSISVVLDNGNAFVGDLAFNMLRIAGTMYQPLLLESQDDLRNSWRKILDNGAKTIYPVHGKPFPAERLKPYLDRRTA